MRIALIPLRTEIKNPSKNRARFQQQMELLAGLQVDVVCLPECTFTGYVFDMHALTTWAEPIPGPTTTWMAEIARQYQVQLCFGLLESAPDGIYNTAVLLSKQGQVLLTHRKIAEHPPFSNGKTVNAIETEFGKVSILICGDLFAAEVIAKLPADTRLLMVPMARSFDHLSPDPERWVREERQAYLAAVAQIGVPAVVVNALDVGLPEGSFGGGMVVDGKGNLLAEAPHGTAESLVYDCDDLSGS